MWDGILNLAAACLHKVAQLVGDWGLAILIITVLLRLLLFPLQQKQYKSTFDMKLVQPRLKEIQEKYGADPQRQQEEAMKINQEPGFNPLDGCLAMFIQMPIFIILFQVLRNKIQVFTSIEDVAFYNILPDLTITVPDAYSLGWATFIPYLLFAILFCCVSVIPMLLQLRQNPDQAAQTKPMFIMMGFLFIWMAYISPAGVILYWATSSGIAAAQQFITNKKLQAAYDAEQEAIAMKPIEVNVERREKKKRPKKKH